ncbi:Aluminum-activated malate transporter [Cynara cardunculus var. scolymus]|uniref:Aluminum-activated malate transporter n=1 Tax=Cynara cardunculus var. scolymus TaxID=59895 RepID=A0A103XE16_CYNCS|nr:Aluminum-activated malate transporter [Cynara cardunculus var. scolymus]
MPSNGPEWNVNVAAVSPQVELGVAKRIFRQLQGQIFECWMKIRTFFNKARNIAANEPKKVIHGLKVGMALSLVSLFYYMRPLYDGVGGNAMWAVMTVVVALEYSVAAAATFSRFIPSVRARFDYGVMIFILTFSFVSMSGYRVDKLLELARNRVSTIAIGTSICILTSMLFYPVWAGKELHNLIYHNLEKLADSLDGCVRDYFKDNEERFSRKQEGYKCVLNSKATEEAMKHLKEVCMTLSSCSSNVLKELAMTMQTMTKSTKTEFFVQEMNFAVQSFQNVFKELLKQPVLLPVAEADEQNSRTCKGEMSQKPQIVPIMGIFPLATMASLLTEIAEQVEGIVAEVDEMAAQAEFYVVNYKEKKGNKLPKFNQDHVILTSLQRV